MLTSCKNGHHKGLVQANLGTQLELLRPNSGVIKNAINQMFLRLDVLVVVYRHVYG